MPIYAIGDVQGCYTALRQLLDAVHFDPNQDTLWFVGDLVNRGPQSLQVLRFVRDLGERAIGVLGNHDLHLLAVAAGLSEKTPRSLQAILDAPDRDALLSWLRQRPLLHHDPQQRCTLIHAGLPPQWDLATARDCANELETVLRGADYLDFLMHMYGDTPDLWTAELQGWDRLRFICNCFTRLRYCSRDGRLALAYKGAPGSQPASVQPWFSLPNRKSRDNTLIFGHWSTLGVHSEPGIYALDSGCVWGGQLTALQLDAEPPRHWSVSCPAPR